MADVDDRRDNYRRGGGRGGGRGYNKRKRFQEDDDFDQQSYRNQRPRREFQAPAGTQIRRGLVEIGEDALRLPHEVAMNLAKLATDNYHDDYVKDTFCQVTLKLVVEQPFKIPFVAGVVLFAHAEKKEIAADIISKAGPQLQEYLEKGQWRECKLMLRFLACMSRVFEEDGVLPVLNELFNRAVDLQTASQEDAVGLELVKIILFTIPYLLASTADASLQQKATELLEKTDIIASTPHQLEALVDPYPTPNDETEKPMACASIISLLQRQLQEEAANGWPLSCIPRIFDPSFKAPNLNGDANGEADGQSASSTITFPSIAVPSPINAGTKALFPELYFSVYADQEIESVPPTTNIASTLIRDAIVDTINSLEFNRNATAKYLNEIDCFWAPNTFVKRAITFDKLRDVEPGRPTWKPEDVVIDAIFSQIFMLPAPEHRLVYYHSIITESCKISPQAIAPSLGRAIRFLFRGLDVMDLELGYRYMDWFAHHLSNFEFRWKWTEWIPEIDLNDLEPKKAFIHGALDKEIRLSFAKRIRETLPEPYHPLIPASKEKDIPDFKFADDQTPFAKEGQEILSMLKKKAPEEDVQRVVDSVHEQAQGLGIADPLVSSTDIYMTAILSIGSKSLSHVLSTIDRCKERLLAIGPQSELARRQIIMSVVDFWADHPGTAVNIIDKLLNYTIVTPMSVIQWALTDNINRGRSLATAQTYELISITMFKVTNRVHQLLQHRNNLKVPFEQRRQIDEALPRERQGMRELFAAIEDAVAGVATGAQDEMIERFDEEEGEQELVKRWGERWARVWRRKASVEEAIVGEASVGALEEAPAVEEVAGAPGPAPVVDEDMDRVE
ncbi:Nuclear cap-binding protein subunit 1 [Vermiconidia calcicola]|uniref:Nuclear cap-binding protein subunit 1 n=1 Tax=Vermiconidia calcicola TaxID=1690605 RepID=A0ACC3NEY5_9PEZI|nr:Nuclear cap-binding protein subunit 1 [Vermiconidia calcicola]